MEIKFRGFKTAGLLLLLNGITYATATNTTGNSAFNPYAVFNAQNTATTSGSGNISTNAVSTGASSATSATTAASTAKPIQYVQPASQVGKFVVPTPVSFNQAPRVQANNKNPNNQVQPTVNNLTPNSANGINTITPNPAPNSLTPIIPGSNLPPSSLIPPAIPSQGMEGSGILQQILANTTSINVAVQSIQTLEQQLGTYWTAVASSQDTQILQSILGSATPSANNPPSGNLLQSGSSPNNLANALALGSSQQTTLLSTTPGALVSLAGTWGNNVTNVQSGLPYLQNLTQGNAVSSPETDSLWKPAVNTALFDLSTNQSAAAQIGQAVNMPFGSQGANWFSYIQSAGAPQLLRVLVAEQAMQNEMIYEILQRQQDQEVMQASELTLLATIHNDLQVSSENQIRQETRIVNAIYNLKNGG